MQRYLHTFIRFIWLLLLPLLIAPPIAALIMGTSTSYTASASLWVETPIYGSQQRNSDGSFWDSPAAQVTNLVNELMSTRSFLTTVLQNTTLKDTVKTEADNAELLDTINKNFKAQAGGWRLIDLSYKDKYSNVSLEVLESIVFQFKAYYDNRIQQQGQGATAYYQDRVNSTKAALDKANQDMVDYLNTHPNQVGSEGATRAVRPEDLEFANMTQNRDNARRNYDDALAALQKIQQSYGAYLQGQDTTVRVQDAPEVFSNQTTARRQYLIGAGVGLGIGLVLVVIGTILLTLLDQTIRQPLFAARALGVRRVMVIENVNPVRGWYNWRKIKMLAELKAADTDKALPPPATLEADKVRPPKVKPRFLLRRSYGENLQ